MKTASFVGAKLVPLNVSSLLSLTVPHLVVALIWGVSLNSVSAEILPHDALSREWRAMAKVLGGLGDVDRMKLGASLMEKARVHPESWWHQRAIALANHLLESGDNSAASARSGKARTRNPGVGWLRHGSRRI